MTTINLDSIFSEAQIKKARRFTAETRSGFLLAQGIGYRSLFIDLMESQATPIFDGHEVTICIYDKSGKQIAVRRIRLSLQIEILPESPPFEKSSGDRPGEGE